MVEDRVENRAQVKLKLMQPQRQIAIAVPLVKHHLFGVDRPAFGERSRREDFADRGAHAVRVVELDVVPGISFVDREDLKHVLVVLLEERFLAFGGPVRWRRSDRIEAFGIGVQSGRWIQISRRESALKLRHLDDIALVGVR